MTLQQYRKLKTPINRLVKDITDSAISKGIDTSLPQFELTVERAVSNYLGEQGFAYDEYIKRKTEDNSIQSAIDEGQVVKNAEMVSFIHTTDNIIKDLRQTKDEVVSESVKSLKKTNEFIDTAKVERLKWDNVTGKPKVHSQEEIKGMIDKGISAIPKGKTGDEIAMEASRIALEEAKTLIPSITDIENDLPQLGANIRDGLELLEGEERLDITAVKGLDDYEEVKKLAKEPKGGGGSTARNFYQLFDVPQNYSGQSGKVLSVKSTEDGLEFVASTDTDEKVKYDSADTSAGYLGAKTVAGTGITLSEGTGGDADKLKITNSAPFVDAASDGNTYGRKNGAWSAIGAGTGDMILASEQSVTGLKTFDKDKLAMKGTSTGTNIISVANTSATSYTNTLPAKDGTFAMTIDIPSVGSWGALNYPTWATGTPFVKMTAAGTFALDTSTYLTSLSGAVLTDQTSGQTIGDTTNRLTKLWATDITCTNAITGSVTGNAGTVTNATLTTALTVNTGTLTLTANVANSSVLTIGAGAVSVSGTNTGDGAAHTQNASTILVPNGVGTPSFDDIQDFLQETRSAGRIFGGVVSAYVVPATPDGKVSISEMQGMIFTTNALGGNYIFFKMAAGVVDLTGLADNTIYWIYYDFNGGTPQYVATSDRTTVHEYDQFTVGRVWRSGNNVEVQLTGHSLYNKDRRSHNRLILKYGNMDRVSGATVSKHATALRLQADAGNWYVANTPFTTDAKDTFKVWYKTGGGAWTESAELTLFSEVFDGGTSTVYENYQNGTSLGALGANKYGVYWLYICPEQDDPIYVVLGTASYNNVGDAQAATIPASLPPYCVNWAKLVGKVICQKTGAALYSVETVFGNTFTQSSATDHASLANLPWGSSGHTGTASTIAGFAAVTGAAAEYTLSGTGTALPTTTAPTFVTSITTPSVLATANDSGAIGASGTAFSDLFLASGAVINFDAGDVTLTHSGNTLTLGGGNLAMGSNAITGTGAISGGIITASAQLISDSDSDTPANGALIDLRRSRDGDPTDDVSDNDVLGEIRFRGYKTNAYYEGAIIRGVVNGTPGASDMPCELIFATSADGSATPTTRLTIDATGLSTFAGAVTLGTSNALTCGSIELGHATENTLSASSGVLSIEGSAIPKGTGTANEIAYWSGTNTLGTLAVATYPSLAELAYVKGVTSAIQTQLGTKAPSANPTFTGTVTLPKTIEIQDTSADHQYVLAVSELTADRTVTLPLLTGTDTFVFNAHTATLTNKRITKRVTTTTDDATAVIDIDTCDVYELSAVANNTEFTTTGTPTDGQQLVIRLKDAGVAKNLTWTGFTAIGVTLPAATVAGKWMYFGATYNTAATAWHIIAYSLQA